VNFMTTLDCVEESIGGSVGKAFGDPFVTRWENVAVLEKCWNLPVEWKSVSVCFPVRGHNCIAKWRLGA